jgi:predicted metallopeptidase
MKDNELTELLVSIQSKFASLSDDDKLKITQELQGIMDEYSTGLKEIENEIKYSSE